MPEYLAPGVYVEETSFRSKSIEGVATTTTGFVGPTRYGPHDRRPDILTSLAEYERTYGDGQQLKFGDGEPTHNYMWHAVRAFFENGGKRLYVVRLLDKDAVAATGSLGAFPKTEALKRESTRNEIDFVCAPPPSKGSVSLTCGDKKLIEKDGTFVGVAGVTGTIDDKTGKLKLTFDAAPASDEKWTLTYNYTVPGVTARFAGAAGNGVLRFQPRAGQHRPFVAGELPKGMAVNTIVEVLGEGWAAPQWRRINGTPGNYVLVPLPGRKLPTDARTTEKDESVPLDAKILRLATASAVIVTFTRDGQSEPVGVWELKPGVEEVKQQFARLPASSELARTLPVIVEQLSEEDLHGGEITLTGGRDGSQPDDYAGREDPLTDVKTGFKALTDLEDISIVAAPGLAGWADGMKVVNGVMAMQAHVEQMRFRVAVVDSMAGQSISDVRQFRAVFDSTHMALYYPWVKVLDPITRKEIVLPPSGFIAGIYARNDVSRAVYKAPANEVVRLALDFERPLNQAHQEVLNPEGINCLRFFEGRGLRVWGARTLSSDPEWKYINVRRYFAYLERSIDRSTQWAVFEPNGPLLWSNIRRTIEDFLLSEYQSGALLGSKPEQAFFVRCDRTTMTQNDLDNGRLICLIGVAPLKPAEFVVFRVGQWTADAKS